MGEVHFRFGFVVICVAALHACALAQSVTVTGAGSTFAAPLYSSWATEFEKTHPRTSIVYRAVGSGAGTPVQCQRGLAMLRKTSDQGILQDQLETQPQLHRKPLASEPFIPEPLLDTDQAAAIMRVHPKTLQRYARQGLVRGFQLGTMLRFRASDIDRWISERLAS